MNVMGDDRQARLRELEERIKDPHSVTSADCLLDMVQAVVTDCDHPSVRQRRNIDSFIRRYESAASNIRNLRMKADDFNLVKVIGKGSFAEIQLVRQKHTDRVYAMKVMNKCTVLKRPNAALFWEERHILANANSEWIVQLHFAFQDQKYLYMVMDYMPGGDLVKLMCDHDVTEEWAQFYCAEVVLAVNVIHSMGFVHRDIKPENMLIDQRGHLKLADFGTCTRVDS